MLEDFLLLDPLLKVFWYTAIPASIIFLIQSIMTFMGSDAFDGAHADFDSNLDGHDTPFQLFSLRNFINFLLGFSWTGISLYGTIASKSLLVIISAGVGLIFVGVFFFFLLQIQKLAEDNTFKFSDIIHLTGQVYLTIPGQRQGKGKVQISVKGSVKEIDAITEQDKIESGSLVKVKSLENDQIAIVERI